MPIPADELSAFFDHHYGETRKHWDRLVDQGAMSEWTRQRKEIRMDEVAMLLRVLAERHAVLTFQPEEQHESTPMIWPPRMRDE